MCSGQWEQWDGEARRNPAEEQSIVGKQGERLWAQGSGSSGTGRPGGILLKSRALWESRVRGCALRAVGAVGALVQLCSSSFSLRNEGALFLCVYGGRLSHESLMSFFRGHRGGQRVLLVLLNIGPWLSIQQEFFSIGSGLWTRKDSLQWESPPPHLLPKD